MNRNRPSKPSLSLRAPSLTGRGAIESLESRRLLATAVNSGVLTLTGGSGADAFVVTTNGTNVTVTENGGSPQSFAASSINSISASLGDGNDFLTIADALVRNATLNGEGGNDTLKGGGGADTLDGGAGNDSLDGGAGLDTVTYAGRSAAITATIHLDYGFGPTPGVKVFTLEGGGGATGEADAYANLETLTGGDGNDSLALTSDSTGDFIDPATSITLRANGGNGNDSLRTSSVYDGMMPTSIPRHIADGGVGNDSFLTGSSTYATTLIGGDGDDHFKNIQDDDIATLVPGAGFDTFEVNLLTYKTYTMPAGLEKIIASNANSIIGNDEDNVIQGSGTDVTIDGRGGNDEIRWTGSKLTAQGGAGNDTIIGTLGGDVLAGGAGDDELEGSSGNDTINPGSGNDTISGSDGIDEISYADRSTPINATLTATIVPTSSRAYIDGVGRVTAGAETDTMHKVEVITGGSGNDTLSVRAENSNLWPLLESDAPAASRQTLRVNGGAGNDTLTGASVYDSSILPIFSVPMLADGGDGNDTLQAFAANGVSLTGGNGDDRFELNDDDSPRPTIDAGPGIDLFSVDRNVQFSYTMPAGLENFTAATPSITVIGNELANEIRLGRDVTVDGMAGDDRIFCTDGVIRGGAGNDVIRVSQQRDPEELVGNGSQIDGGDGNDDIRVHGGTDTIRGGNGNDTVYAGVGNDRVWGGAGNDRLNGDGGKDLIRGESGDDRVYGNSGSDKLYGGDGTDRLSGGNSNDHLDGEGGRDYLNGDEGTDTAKRQRTDRRYQNIEIFL